MKLPVRKEKGVRQSLLLQIDTIENMKSDINSYPNAHLTSYQTQIVFNTSIRLAIAILHLAMS